MEFKGYPVYMVENTTREVVSVIQEGTKLNKYKIETDGSKWTVKNEDSNKTYYVNVDTASPEKSLQDLLSAVKAFKKLGSLSQEQAKISYKDFVADILANGQATFWARADYEKCLCPPPANQTVSNSAGAATVNPGPDPSRPFVESALKKIGLTQKELKERVDLEFKDIDTKTIQNFNETVEFVLNSLTSETLSKAEVKAITQIL